MSIRYMVSYEKCNLIMFDDTNNSCGAHINIFTNIDGCPISLANCLYSFVCSTRFIYYVNVIMSGIYIEIKYFSRRISQQFHQNNGPHRNKHYTVAVLELIYTYYIYIWSMLRHWLDLCVSFYKRFTGNAIKRRLRRLLTNVHRMQVEALKSKSIYVFPPSHAPRTTHHAITFCEWLGAIECSKGTI